MARLFLSYRRSDTGAYADRLARHLASYQFDAVFQDRQDIELGENYADRIRSSLSQCSAVLVLIGKDWLAARDAQGRRRLDDPTDWVRREVTMALSLKLPIITVRFDYPHELAPSELPRDLAALLTTHGYDINGNYFERDASDLCVRLEKLLVAAERTASPGGAAPSASRLLNQLRIIWIGLAVITLGASVAPVLVPALPGLFWIFPGSMTMAAFLWWLYWLGESTRPARMRVA